MERDDFGWGLEDGRSKANDTYRFWRLTHTKKQITTSHMSLWTYPPNLWNKLMTNAIIYYLSLISFRLCFVHDFPQNWIFVLSMNRYHPKNKLTET